MVSVRVNIAHFKENISWANILKQQGYEVMVYHKDTNLTQYDAYTKINDNEVMLMNIGREPHTYLMHIINNYDDLRDYEIFFQGRIDDHMEGRVENNIKDLFGKDYLSWCVRANQKIGCFNEEAFQEAKRRHPGHIHINQFYGEVAKRDVIFLQETFPNLNTPKEPFYFNARALFGVKRETIRFYPKEFYERLLNYFNPNYKNYMNMTPEDFAINMTYTFESFWDYIFTYARYNLT